MTKLQRQIFEETLRLLYSRKNTKYYDIRPKFVCNIFPDAYQNVTNKPIDWQVVDSCINIFRAFFSNDKDYVIFRIIDFDYSYKEANDARILALHFILTKPKSL